MNFCVSSRNSQTESWEAQLSHCEASEGGIMRIYCPLVMEAVILHPSHLLYTMTIVLAHRRGGIVQQLKPPYNLPSTLLRLDPSPLSSRCHGSLAMELNTRA